jgi:threonine dehydratase
MIRTNITSAQLILTTPMANLEEGVWVRTPLIRSNPISEIIGANAYLKLEVRNLGIISPEKYRL